MFPFRGENRGVKRKNDYYYIIKLGIFQRKSEKTRRCFFRSSAVVFIDKLPACYYNRTVIIAFVRGFAAASIQ